MKIGQAVFLQDLKLARRHDGAAVQALPEQLPDGPLVSLDAGHGLDYMIPFHLSILKGELACSESRDYLTWKGPAVHLIASLLRFWS